MFVLYEACIRSHEGPKVQSYTQQITKTFYLVLSGLYNPLSTISTKSYVPVNYAKITFLLCHLLCPKFSQFLSQYYSLHSLYQPHLPSPPKLFYWNHFIANDYLIICIFVLFFKGSLHLNVA